MPLRITNIRQTTLLAQLFVGLVIAAACMGVYADDVTTPGADDTEALPIHGSLSLRYVPRWTENEDDQDLYGLVSLDYGDRYSDPVSAHLLTSLSFDFDGHGDRRYYQSFDSITDTGNKNLHTILQEAYVNVRVVPAFETVRIGRMTLLETAELLQIDGLWAESDENGDLRIQGGAYGGIPTNRFESSHSGDFVLGGYIQLRPWQGARGRLEHMYIEDDFRFQDNENHLSSLRLWQNVGPVDLYASYSHQELRERDMQFRATYRDTELDLVVQGSYYQLLRTRRDLAVDIDPFVNVMFDYIPYHLAHFVASKGFGTEGMRIVIDAGCDVRWVHNETDATAFNREFERYYVTPTFEDLPLEGMSFSVTGELWNSGGRDYQSAGMDVSYAVGGGIDASVGTYYSLFKYDLFDNAERDRVQTYFARLKGEVAPDTKVRLEYEFENDEYDRYHKLQVGLQWSF